MFPIRRKTNLCASRKIGTESAPLHAFFATVLLLICAFNATAQYSPLAPPNTFRSADNPIYWKNRAPNADYWQQDVHYRIGASIEETTGIIYGNMEMSYWNNSPDTLYEVFFHLYQNAFQPDSYADRNDAASGTKHRFGKYEQQKKERRLPHYTSTDIL